MVVTRDSLRFSVRVLHRELVFKVKDGIGRDYYKVTTCVLRKHLVVLWMLYSKVDFRLDKKVGLFDRVNVLITDFVRKNVHKYEEYLLGLELGDSKVSLSEFMSKLLISDFISAKDFVRFNRLHAFFE